MLTISSHPVHAPARTSPMTKKNASGNTVIVWLRRDLRVCDNPALAAAAEGAGRVAPVFILDERGPFAPGGAAKWWLHHSLAQLGARLQSLGSPLILRRGVGPEIIERLAEETGADAVYWNRRYDQAGREEDAALKARLREGGVEARSFNGALLREPWELETKTGGFYRVFTPFWRALQAAGPARTTAPTPKKRKAPTADIPGDALEDWALLPTRPNWASEFGDAESDDAESDDFWRPGEDGAASALAQFLDERVGAYADDRNRPDVAGTSRLSPHLAFGEISPLQIWTETRARLAEGRIPEKGANVFLSEIAWREFSYNLLFHYPDIQHAPIKPEYENFPWAADPEGLDAWTKGLTGIPIVDAGMRQLWRKGWMHNRVRMIVASFLVKNMLVPWREGERWFWDTLLDADPANNPASWQWVAGSGADAAPYFRIFNPVSQGEKFDPEGDYVRAFVPELANMPAKHIHAPFKAPEDVLSGAGVVLGETYPRPLVDLGETRKRALSAYDEMRNV